jgi:hypothetical protein
MDSCREISKIKTEKTAVREALPTFTDVIASVGLLFMFAAYLIGATVNRAVRFVRSGKFAYFMGLRRRTVYGVCAGVAAFALIGAIGGIEAGVISLAVGLPLCLGLALAVKLLTDD